MKIISYNVNGIRSAVNKGLLDWLAQEDPDVFMVQETKAQPEQIPYDEFSLLGYEMYAHSAVKKGYSGVATFSKTKPDKVVEGMGIAKYDNEGRVLRTDFGGISLLNTYFPSGSSGDDRQAFKMEFLSDYFSFLSDLRKERPALIVSGDFNICHLWIDIHNPEKQQQTSGFLPEERQWMDEFVASGFLDTFRAFNTEPDHYSWWSYRAGSRQRNKGWRIDYHMATEALRANIQSASILPQVVHSDHCPVVLEITHT